MHIVFALLLAALILFVLRLVMKAADPTENLRISETDGEFSLVYFNYKKKVL